jgi:hypothetical protein
VLLLQRLQSPATTGAQDAERTVRVHVRAGLAAVRWLRSGFTPFPMSSAVQLRSYLPRPSGPAAVEVDHPPPSAQRVDQPAPCQPFPGDRFPQPRDPRGRQCRLDMLRPARQGDGYGAEREIRRDQTRRRALRHDDCCGFFHTEPLKWRAVRGGQRPPWQRACRPKTLRGRGRFHRAAAIVPHFRSTGETSAEASGRRWIRATPAPAAGAPTAPRARPRPNARGTVLTRPFSAVQAGLE